MESGKLKEHVEHFSGQHDKSDQMQSMSYVETSFREKGRQRF